MANKNTKHVRFTNTEKSALKPGQEITDGEIIWRKLKGSSGVWRYDFRLNGRRYKGILGHEKNAATLSARLELNTAVYALRQRWKHLSARTRPPAGPLHSALRTGR